jgi:hypothetical protein
MSNVLYRRHRALWASLAIDSLANGVAVGVNDHVAGGRVGLRFGW